MPVKEKLQVIAKSIVREIDHYGRSAPFIGYVTCTSNGQPEQVFVTRETVLPQHTPPSSQNITYARYRLPLGRIAESEPGTNAIVRVPLRAGQVAETTYKIKSRTRFVVRYTDGIVDAHDNYVALPGESHYVEVLRPLISGTATETSDSTHRPKRRRITERLELPDTPVVDAQQGEVWRTHIRRFMVITGAPGTGKTTTIIKRIAQKSDHTTLGEELMEIPESRRREWLSGRQGWVLFTPSDLLRNYLQLALAEERLPSTETNVPLWHTTRMRIGRDVLKLFGQGRFFTLAAGVDLVGQRHSETLVKWTKRFERHFTSRLQSEFKRLVTTKAASLDGTKRKTLARLEALNHNQRLLRASLRESESSLTTAVNAADRNTFRRRIEDLESKISPIQSVLQGLHSAATFWAEVETFAASDNLGIGLWVRSIRALRTKLMRLNRTIRSVLPPADQALAQSFMNASQDVLGSVLGEAEDSVDGVLRKLPIVYHEYRLFASSKITTFYRDGTGGAINDKRIDPLEIDTIIYLALKIVREVFAADVPESARDSMTGRLVSEYRYIVAVDEAADFSVVELACMRMIAHPALDCVTFAGDLMQRMTTQGLSDWRHLAELVEMPEIHELKHSYRQTKRLLDIAAELFRFAVGHAPGVDGGFKGSDDDPAALRYKAPGAEAEATWLVGRIGEIYRACGERLPSIALLTPTEADIGPLARLLKGSLLEAFGIDVEECPQGRVLGSQANVRIFSVQYIKGLEFESVFFVGIDRMAAANPGLVDRFLYVGLTRARSFLAVTYTGRFPMALRHVERVFATDDWSAVGALR